MESVSCKVQKRTRNMFEKGLWMEKNFCGKWESSFMPKSNHFIILRIKLCVEIEFLMPKFQGLGNGPRRLSGEHRTGTDEGDCMNDTAASSNWPWATDAFYYILYETLFHIKSVQFHMSCNSYFYDDLIYWIPISSLFPEKYKIALLNVIYAFRNPKALVMKCIRNSHI